LIGSAGYLVRGYRYFDWLVGSLAVWLVGWMIGVLIRWLVFWLTGWFLAGWLIC